MGTAARVWSLTSIEDVRNALRVFQERGDAAVASLRTELNRTLQWLEHDQPRYWTEQIQRGFDRVASARVALETCRNKTVAGHRSECIEEKVALKRAKERLEYCQEQLEVNRRWARVAREAGDEFVGRLGPFQRLLEFELEQMAVSLNAMLTALEAYQDRPVDTSEAPTETTTSTDKE